MKIALGLPHINESVDTRFSDSLNGLIARSLQEGIELIRITTHRDIITFARNKIATKALEHECDYLFFIDDDMVFESDLLINLLKHKKSVVSGMCFLRTPPHEPSMFTLNNDQRTYDPVYMWKPGELRACDAVGMACTLIDIKVLEKLMPNCVKYKGVWGFFDNADYIGEDMRFCKKVRDMDIEILCDTGQKVGHIWKKIVGYGDYAALSEEKIYHIRKHEAEIKYDSEMKKGMGTKQHSPTDDLL